MQRSFPLQGTEVTVVTKRFTSKSGTFIYFRFITYEMFFVIILMIRVTTLRHLQEKGYQATSETETSSEAYYLWLR